jgi:HD superfamily phosphohydrolase
MYWQVYLHKTVVVAEKMLVNVMDRARQLLSNGIDLPIASPTLNFFLKEHQPDGNFIKHLEKFSQIDDTDVMCTLKHWCHHFDPILSRLSKGLTDRKLLKIKFQSEPYSKNEVELKCNEAVERLNISPYEASYFVFTGEAVNTTYNPYDERIKILFKDGTVSDISSVDNALIHQHLSSPVKKYYLCHLR